jgi:hypothetical protein
MRKFMAVAILLGVCSLLACAQSGLGLIQPDAGFVFGIEWRKIVNSTVGALMTEQMTKGQLPPIPGAKELMDALLHDLDSVVISASSSVLNKTAGGTPPALIVLKGRFKPELRSLLQGIAKDGGKYRSVDLFIMPQDKPAAGTPAASSKNVIAFLDAATVIGGDIAEVRRAIDRAQAGRLTSGRGGILEGIGDLASTHDVWMVFDLPPNALKEAPQMASQMFTGVKGAELGISFEDGLGLHLNVRTKDDAAAVTVAQALQGLIAMGAMSQSQSPQAGEVLRKIRIGSENSRVKLALNLDKSELEKMIKEAQAGAKAAPKAALAPARTPEPAGPKVLRITGLDSGPVEVPYSKK